MPPIDRDRAAAVTRELQDNLVEILTGDRDVSRRTVLGGIGVAGGAALAGRSAGHEGEEHGGSEHGNFGAVGQYEDTDFDPHGYLRTFNTGRSGQDSVPQRVYEEGGRTVREFELTAVDTTITIAPGVEFSAWAYNGQVPGPTLRVQEGDLVRIKFENLSRHAHTIHPHLKNLNPAMDGVPTNGPGVLDQTESFTYEWIAQPMGCHFYHCHSLPLKEHIHRGLYGAIIVDPDPERVRERPREYVNYHGPMTDDLVDELVDIAKSRNHEYPESDDWDEQVMVMNGFDTNFDGDNEVYAVNTRAFAYSVADTDGKGTWSHGSTIDPIAVERDRPVRLYLVNAIEFDPINSLHTHSQFFDYYDHGTTLMPSHKRIDTVMQCQAQRGILEIDYSDHQPGLYMFHAHQSEFAELGWMSFFEVT